MNEFAIILFHSTNNGMWAAKILKKESIERKLIPIPRHLSSDCGYCLRIKKEDISKVKELLDKNEVEYDRFENI